MRAPSAISFSLTLLVASALPSIRSRETANYLKLPFTREKQTNSNDINQRAITSPLANQIYLYTIDVVIGTPPQAITVVLDTGSSDTWFYAPEAASSCVTCTNAYYDYSRSSSKSILNSLGVFNISYGTPNSGVTGFYASDIFSISGVAVRQTIGVATVAHAGDPSGGIMGVGLSQGESIVYHGGKPYAGYIDTLATTGIIKTRAYSVFFNDRTPAATAAGTIIFGGYDSTKWLGKLIAFQLVEPAPDGAYRLDIDAPAMAFTLKGQTYRVTSSSAAYTVLLDTGTAISRIPADQFNAINTIVQAQIIGDGPIYAVPCTLANQAGGVSFAFSGPNGSVVIQVPWLELVVPDRGLPSGYCAFGLAPESGGHGVHVLGDTFLRSAYLLYNFDAGTISLAQASYDNTRGHITEI